ncbi:hypothetical protein T440DRAFT_473524 [Plenodomus tracheiphilus IPT5]|uniref:DNA/RNA-binding domain-containing protein n=1 Tax=Plenodomus tracheiphilus IPT5 TaxID=1408161 RepID=A0A6A7AMK9_9PLEO|nr:hypothetical protein T440DRAFT_473524 [Plenodomus tracheiphilus IPT5]
MTKPKFDFKSGSIRLDSTADSQDGTLPCPISDHHGQISQDMYPLYDHVEAAHGSQIEGVEPRLARTRQLRSEQMSEATAGGRSTPSIAGLTLETNDERQPSPPSRNKRPTEAEPQMDAEFPRKTPYTIPSDRNKLKSQDQRLFDPKQYAKGVPSPHRMTPEPSSEWLTDANKTIKSQPQSPIRQSPHCVAAKQQMPQRQPGLIELQRYDSRYPGLLLQPDSRPISQEQLASEVKSIYAGLTMIETKCIHVDNAQAAAVQDISDSKLTSDHWQALIALHRTLLHEHHDFFIASQHPLASLALLRLADKYSMPARMWKHGIHSFLELLRRHLPASIDYMLAFIYAAYQMMALLYETVPAFEDTWIECLGDLGRYRMANEDEDIRDRETWAGVACFWYKKAADRNPTVGRLYHHLAILARPNALQQLYYYARSFTCVKLFPSAQESILTLLDPILGREVATYSDALPIDTNFIKGHALLFEKISMSDFQDAKQEFLSNLDNHIGRVTAKWKEQGIYIAITNVAGVFGYGKDGNAFRQVFLTELQDKAKTSPSKLEETLRTASPVDQQGPDAPIAADKVAEALEEIPKSSTFKAAISITNETFALVLRRIGDKNVLPHVHIMLAYLNAFAANRDISFLLADVPWIELFTFLNALVRSKYQSQSQNQNQVQYINTLLSADLFPDVDDRIDELPLPEDYLVRGLIWTHYYFPEKWFARERDDEERYLELPSTVKSRTERVLRLGFRLTKVCL